MTIDPLTFRSSEYFLNYYSVPSSVDPIGLQQTPVITTMRVLYSAGGGFVLTIRDGAATAIGLLSHCCFSKLDSVERCPECSSRYGKCPLNILTNRGPGADIGTVEDLVAVWRIQAIQGGMDPLTAAWHAGQVANDLQSFVDGAIPKVDNDGE